MPAFTAEKYDADLARARGILEHQQRHPPSRGGFNNGYDGRGSGDVASSEAVQLLRDVDRNLRAVVGSGGSSVYDGDGVRFRGPDPESGSDPEA
jgi:hypothetical protein